ncbi:hypothetical protein C2845_PM06G19700 [Panicum miliaceum]|uniref:Uncharacterized protein n=1 Tax=Panicum miliaceum TaxID=4540 RepID=A0A3L6R5T9_PANMI|nr:hypothetical protein C2845_PM06G19700 [Panicum miliaceum]
MIQFELYPPDHGSPAALLQAAAGAGGEPGARLRDDRRRFGRSIASGGRRLLNDNAILVAALALRVVQGALRVTRRACHDGADDGAPQAQDPEHGTGGGGGAGQAGAARHGGKLVQALPCLAYSAGLEAGSSPSHWAKSIALPRSPAAEGRPCACCRAAGLQPRVPRALH